MEQRQTVSTPNAPRWDLSKLVVVEPDYPNDLPTWDEFRLWFGSCVAVFGLAGLFACLSALISRASASVVGKRRRELIGVPPGRRRAGSAP